MSPIRTRWLAFLIGKPLTAIAPAAHSRAASDRLLTKRANHSHWSRRVLVRSTPAAIALKRISAPSAWQRDGLLAAGRAVAGFRGRHGDVASRQKTLHWPGSPSDSRAPRRRRAIRRAAPPRSPPARRRRQTRRRASGRATPP